MNETAKKLREVADRMSDGVVNSAPAIIMTRKMFDVRSTTTFGGDLGNVLTAIADELDELQARATEANNLRKKLESAEDKAESRKQHIGYLETALHDKNVLFKQRGRTIARLTAECSELRKQVPTERERQILALWPKWSNGDYCMFGDLWTAQPYGDREPKQLTKLSILSPKLLEEWDQAQGENFAYEWNFLRPADTTYRPEKAERPASKVLDADGVEIKNGDTVWYRSLCTMGSMRKAMVTGFDENCLGGKLVTLKDEAGKTWYIDPKKITHVQPDSWERLEMDAAKEPCDYFGVEHDEDKGCSGCPHLREGRDCTIALQADLIRRAKALAGAEAGR